MNRTLTLEELRAFVQQREALALTRRNRPPRDVALDSPYQKELALDRKLHCTKLMFDIDAIRKALPQYDTPEMRALLSKLTNANTNVPGRQWNHFMMSCERDFGRIVGFRRPR